MKLIYSCLVSRQLLLIGDELEKNFLFRFWSPTFYSTSTRGLKINLSKCTLIKPLGSGHHLYVTRSNFHQSIQHPAQYKLKKEECYKLLGVTEDSDEADVRYAYLRLAKMYHPDSGTATADARKFTQLQTAYQTVLKDMKGDDEEEDVPPEEIFDIKHTAPQHRQYLNYEGIGMGSPTQREKQYQKYKVRRATENVYEHRMHKWAEQKESSIVLVNKRKARQIKTSNTIARIVEDLIADAMNKGEFDQLEGKGKPLSFKERNPLVDADTHNLNKILINNGYLPEWITMEKDIKDHLRRARQDLAVARNLYILSNKGQTDAKKWEKSCDSFRKEVTDANHSINKFNLVVPIMQKQMFHFNAEKLIKSVEEHYLQFLPKEPPDFHGSFDQKAESDFIYSVDSKLTFRQAVRDMFHELGRIFVKMPGRK